MACCDVDCRDNCGWEGTVTNDDIKECPICGGDVNEFLDEYPEMNEELK